MRPSLRDYVLNAAPVGAPHSRLRPEPPRQLTLEPAGATRVNTSRRGTPSVQRAMGCDTQSRSACTRQDRLRLRQRTHCPNLRKSSPNPRPDQSYRCRGWVWPAQYFGILRAQGSVWSSASQSAWPVRYFGALEASARPPRNQSAWPALHFARVGPADRTNLRLHLRPCWPSARPICVARATFAAT